MYEALEHWKQYQKELKAKELQKKISKKFGLSENINNNFKEFDIFLNNLAKKNGTTKY